LSSANFVSADCRLRKLFLSSAGLFIALAPTLPLPDLLVVANSGVSWM
jgi:hypothetical protein